MKGKTPGWKNPEKAAERMPPVPLWLRRLDLVKAEMNAVKEIVRQAIDYLRQKIRVRRAILFGSHARGEADEWSDIDLAVISPDFARMSHQEVMELLVEVALSVDPALEIRPYTPQDLKEARSTNFLGHILTEGRVVYEDDKFLL